MRDVVDDVDCGLVRSGSSSSIAFRAVAIGVGVLRIISSIGGSFLPFLSRSKTLLMIASYFNLTLRVSLRT